MTDQKNKSGLDEQTFSKLLEAAYVLQEHNRKKSQKEANCGPDQEPDNENVRAQGSEIQPATAKNISHPNSDYTLTLAEIVEVQNQIQLRHLEADQAMELVVERIARITNASGAGIGIIDGDTIRYRAGAGSSALPSGSELPVEDAICAKCVRTGQVVRTPDISEVPLFFDADLCRKRHIQSVVAVPIYHDGDIVGALELYFDRLHGFAEQDIHTCQLMAGLMTEAIGRSAETALKKSVDAERSSMLAAIEMLKPNLVALAEDFISESATHEEAQAESETESSTCWKCGDKLVEQEQFCGNCGAPRVGDADPSSVQSKVASAWRIQQTVRQEPASVSDKAASLEIAPAEDAADTNADEDRDHIAELFPRRTLREDPGMPLPSLDASVQEEGVEEEAAQEANALSSSSVLQNKVPQNNSLQKAVPYNDLAQSTDADLETDSVALTVPAKEEPISPAPHLAAEHQETTWSSAAKAKEFLEGLSETGSPSAFVRLWRARRGDFYLAIAIVLVFAVIRWGVFSSGPAVATGRGSALSANASRRKADAGLSLFDKALINLGLAEAPEAPEYKGNPDTQVWIDSRTALYYCPDSGLYGKTSKGRFASQRDAQLDQFEPASRKACD
ncbi:MAG: GAF domain-containing protein [Candidatus Sulfotelmatobacter sp.]